MTFKKFSSNFKKPTLYITTFVAGAAMVYCLDTCTSNTVVPTTNTKDSVSITNIYNTTVKDNSNINSNNKNYKSKTLVKPSAVVKPAAKPTKNISTIVLDTVKPIDCKETNTWYDASKKYDFNQNDYR